jgi:high-affinity Fe2+/Pb2+ permease
MDKWHDFDWLGALFAGAIATFGSIIRLGADAQKFKTLREAVLSLIVGALAAFATGVAIFWICISAFRSPVEFGLALSLLSGILGVGSWAIGEAAHNLVIKYIEKKAKDSNKKGEK